MRAFAASGVVFLHSNATVFGIHTEFHGVALFFVLSGYLMCRIRNRSARNFLADRFWRIVPAYWAATALMLWTFNMWTHWPFYHVALSYLFIPHQAPSGLHPVLGVGWTLNFEVYFYVLFGVAIYLNKRFAPLIAAAMVAFFYVMVPLITDSEALRFYYAGSTVWYFVAGIAIYYLDSFVGRLKLKIQLPYWTFPACLALFVVLTIVAALGMSYPMNGSTLAMILPPALFLTGVLAARFGADLKAPFLILLGNASYGCYLLHTIFIELMRHRGIAIDGSIIKTGAILIASWTLAMLWHLTFEKLMPLLRNAIYERDIVRMRA
jgi:exopolysaccharide production protein ExoZ